MSDYLYCAIEQNRVGEFYLGISKKELDNMGVVYKYTCNGKSVEIYGLSFYFIYDDLVGEPALDTICIHEGFRGKFLEKLGIGTIPYETEGIEYYGEILPGMDNIFVLPDYPGITFSVNKKKICR